MGGLFVIALPFMTLVSVEVCGGKVKFSLGLSVLTFVKFKFRYTISFVLIAYKNKDLNVAPHFWSFVACYQVRDLPLYVIFPFKGRLRVLVPPAKLLSSHVWLSLSSSKGCQEIISMVYSCLPKLHHTWKWKKKSKKHILLLP